MSSYPQGFASALHRVIAPCKGQKAEKTLRIKKGQVRGVKVWPKSDLTRFCRDKHDGGALHIELYLAPRNQ